MFLSAVVSLILTAPIHCRWSIGEQVIKCYISPNLFWWRSKLIYILEGLRVRKFSANFNFWWTIHLTQQAQNKMINAFAKVCKVSDIKSFWNKYLKLLKLLFKWVFPHYCGISDNLALKWHAWTIQTTFPVYVGGSWPEYGPDLCSLVRDLATRDYSASNH